MQDEFVEVSKVENVNKLLEKVETKLVTSYQISAYNYLIEYVENPEWFTSHEGQRLLGLCLEILRAIS